MGPVRGAGRSGDGIAGVPAGLSVWRAIDAPGAVVVGAFGSCTGGAAGAQVGGAEDVDPGRVWGNSCRNWAGAGGAEGPGGAYHDDVAGRYCVDEPGALGESAGD